LPAWLTGQEVLFKLTALLSGECAARVGINQIILDCEKAFKERIVGEIRLLELYLLLLRHFSKQVPLTGNLVFVVSFQAGGSL
jgi:hypothetical protein